MNLFKLVSMGWLAFAVSPFLGGCSGHDEMGTMGQLSSQMQTRESAYHDAVASLSDADQVREETNQYATDMNDMLSQMESTCSEKMTEHNGMMGNTDVSQLCGMQDDMMMAVSDHQERINGMTDVATMKAECGEHYQTMQGMLDTMDSMMSGDMM
ncbi:MAG TPA: hypothetical protein VI895_03365 [Bdellovibrionota bacterium]|nr:hypothetical protein [Bdellovibrionota bacterium]